MRRSSQAILISMLLLLTTSSLWAQGTFHRRTIPVMMLYGVGVPTIVTGVPDVRFGDQYTDTTTGAIYGCGVTSSGSCTSWILLSDPRLGSLSTAVALSPSSQIVCATETVKISGSGGPVTLTSPIAIQPGVRVGQRCYLHSDETINTVTLPHSNGVHLVGASGTVTVASGKPLMVKWDGVRWLQEGVGSLQQGFNIDNRIQIGTDPITGLQRGNLLDGNGIVEYVEPTGRTILEGRCGGTPCGRVHIANLVLISEGTKPVCDATHEFLFWSIPATVSTASRTEQCCGTNSSTYAWTLGTCSGGGASAPLISRVQSAITAGTGGENSRSVAFSTNTQGNTLLVAACGVFQGTFSTTPATFTDNQESGWSVAINVGVNDGASHQTRLYLAYKIAPTAGVYNITCDPPGTSNYITLVIAEYSGIALSSPLDQVATNADPTGSASVTSGTTATTVQANELLIGLMSHASSTGATSITPVAPLLQVEEEEDWTQFENMAVGDRVLSSTGTFAAQWTLGTSEPYVAGVATFKGQ
jgi:hypothetical protein